MKTKLFQGFALASLVTVMSSPLYAQTAAAANNQPQESVGNEAGYGIGAALASVFYIPAKVTYAGLGLLTGGLGFVLTGGRADVSNKIIYSAGPGDYFVTPTNLKGTQPSYIFC